MSVTQDPPLVEAAPTAPAPPDRPTKTGLALGLITVAALVLGLATRGTAVVGIAVLFLLFVPLEKLFALRRQRCSAAAS